MIVLPRPLIRRPELDLDDLGTLDGWEEPSWSTGGFSADADGILVAAGGTSLEHRGIGYTVTGAAVNMTVLATIAAAVPPPNYARSYLGAVCSLAYPRQGGFLVQPVVYYDGRVSVRIGYWANGGGPVMFDGGAYGVPSKVIGAGAFSLMLRLQREGQIMRAKFWNGSATAEPEAWDIVRADLTESSWPQEPGFPGLYARGDTTASRCIALSAEGDFPGAGGGLLRTIGRG